MEFLQKLFEWANGKKTAIGTVLLVASTFIDQVLIGFWGLSGTWVAPLMQTLDWLGMALGGTGLAHKVVKFQKAKTTSIPEPNNDPD